MAKERRQARRKASPKVWTFYKIQGSTMVRLKKECQRCGKGVFLAEHKDRLSCGKCGYTLWRKQEGGPS